MSPLFTNKGKLLIVDGKLATSENCCCDEYAIFTCNSNAVTDDRFDILLNGQKIGTHIADQDNVVNGNFWATDAAITRQLLTCDNCVICAADLNLDIGNPRQELCDVCAESNDIIDGAVDKKLFKKGLNTINMNNVQGNGRGNYGRIWVIKFKKNPPEAIELLLSDEYAGFDLQDFGPYNFNI